MPLTKRLSERRRGWTRPVILFPVILPVGEEVERLSGEEKVALLSRVSRRALALSAEKTGVVLGEVRKDENDVPLPVGDYYWSISHKPKYVAAVVGDYRIGIDIEEIRPRPDSIFHYVAGDEEWELGGGRSLDNFFRFWTAKEAVVKALGIGLRGLRKCRVMEITDSLHITLEYQNRLWHVEQLSYDNHIAAVLKEDNEVEWIVPCGASSKLGQGGGV